MFTKALRKIMMKAVSYNGHCSGTPSGPGHCVSTPNPTGPGHCY